MKTYQQYKNNLAGISFPYACLDMDLFKQNIAENLRRASNKKIRIASKSIRCVSLMRMILEYDDQYQGIMTYHGKEALFLAKEGFDDLLMGYPIVDKSILEEIGEQIKQGTYICLMIDAVRHLEILEEVGKKVGVTFPFCLDLDMSDDYPGLHFGVWRSSIQDETDLTKILKAIQNTTNARLDGIMGYEAQVAGVGNNGIGQPLKNGVIKLLQKRAIKRVAARRKKAVELINEMGFHLKFVNGGGTGSVESTVSEEVVTEVTVGSGFYQSHLFDYYNNFTLQPALFYGVQILRKPKKHIYTCHGGGYIASGAIEKVKAPIVHLPTSGYLTELEGAGEVQTPILFKNLQEDLNIGDPIFLRYCKAGELCERFNTIILLSDSGKKEVPTYRGQLCNFG